VERLYSFSMAFGRATGCHQMPERSFFFHGKQFPVCARCTGVFLGELVSVVVCRWFHPPLWLVLSFCALILLDWGIQALEWKESTNFRRLTTGLLCGYAIGYEALVLLKRILF